MIPHGTILVKIASEQRLYSVKDLHNSRELTTGQLFLAVANLYSKTPTEYGTTWPSYSKNRALFNVVRTEIDKQKNDYDKLVLVCKQLGEVIPAIVDNDKILLE